MQRASCLYCGARAPIDAVRCSRCDRPLSLPPAGPSLVIPSAGVSRRAVVKGLAGLAAAGGALPWLVGCQPSTGASGKPTQSPSLAPTASPTARPPAATRPIEHIVIIFKENHTFDNYFGRFPGADGITLPQAHNPPDFDPPHDHTTWTHHIGHGAIQQQYTREDIPAYYAYAEQFTLCDRYFSEVGGPSDPNHLMLITADSPVVDAFSASKSPSMRPPFDLPSLPANLSAAGISWRNYGGFIFDDITALKKSPNSVPSAQFALDAAAGKLPAVSWLFAHDTDGLDEHPPAPLGPGEAWTVTQVNAIIQGGLWPKTAIFITWDDWGGWSDHVVPPNVEQWTDGTQFRYGSRVGCIVLGPYAKSGYISHVLHSHISLLKFCETTFSLPTLSARDAAADDMSDCFDFTQTPLPPPSQNPGA